MERKGVMGNGGKNYNKLVRDRIPEIIEGQGEKAITRRLSETLYETALNRKLIEEAQEYLNDQTLEELADVWEVILALLRMRGSGMKKLEEIRLRKLRGKGGFDKRILLERVTENR